MSNFEENVYSFIAESKQFNYRIEGMDNIWDIIFPHKTSHKKVYHYLRVTKYNDTFYFGIMEGEFCSLEIKLNKSVHAAPTFGYSHGDLDFDRKWTPLISSASKWLKCVKKDWIKSNKEVLLSYPLNRRYGIVCHAVIKQFLPDLYRIDAELGKVKTKQFIKLVEQGVLRDSYKPILPSMSANDYFEYCKIAYGTGQRDNEHVDTNLTGRQMYQLYADGRNEGLLDITGDSKEEFADWMDGKHPKKLGGGHPWEIKRGGNTTHIDLSVARASYQEGFVVKLRGQSINRLKETIRMFLGIYEAGLPISIEDPEGIRKRLLGQDNIGIIPSFNSLHRANQHFHPCDSVYDVMHYDDLGRYKNRIKPFITWETLPMLIPKEHKIK